MKITTHLLSVAALTLAWTTEAQVTPTQKHTIQEISSIFESSSPDFDFGFSKNIGDERGITFGFVGFTTGTYSGKMFVDTYTQLNPRNPLADYDKMLGQIDKEVHDEEGRSARVHGIEGLHNAIAACIDDPLFIQAQLIQVDKTIWDPSQKLADELNLRTPLSRGQMYDAQVNHGEDGINDLVRKTNAASPVGTVLQVGEIAWISKFLTTRLKLLQADPVWQLATDRIKVYQKLLQEKRYDLKLPLVINCYGNTFTLDDKPMKIPEAKGLNWGTKIKDTRVETALRQAAQAAGFQNGPINHASTREAHPNLFIVTSHEKSTMFLVDPSTYAVKSKSYDPINDDEEQIQELKNQ